MNKANKSTGTFILYILTNEALAEMLVPQYDFREKELGGTMFLYDMDAMASKSNEEIGNRISARPDAAGKWNYRVADDLEEPCGRFGRYRCFV